ncbi:MAG: polysaccharide deacetylase family protein [Gammaproteobacteria bacterium]|nr:polysaccharide deacetylase family protein [Gammaproteobacteria bacterium]
MQKSRNYLLLLISLWCFITPAYSALISDESSAVILMYHHIARDTPDSTSVTPETFKNHLEYLSENGFRVWSLRKMLKHLVTSKPIPDRTVVLTFDDAYQSVFSEAFPLLKARNWPFTIFVTTEYMSNSSKNYMSWEQLKEVQRYGADIGNHTMSHPHMIRFQSNETEQQWHTRIVNEIEQAQQLLKKMKVNPIKVLAYPYGEYNPKIKQLLHKMDYLALGQHSGAVGAFSDMQALPRYPIGTGFDDMKNFAIKVRTKPLPVKVISPDDGIVSKDSEMPELILELKTGNYNENLLTCYASGQGRIQLEWINKEKHLLSVLANKNIKPGRTKYNCTAPSKTDKDIYYWFSFLWMKPNIDGKWYEE